MKKLLICLLALTLLLSLFAACNNDQTETTDTKAEQTTENETDTQPSVNTDTGLEDAKSYLEALYKDASEITAGDYELIGALRVDGVAYKLEWSVDTDAVKITVGEKSVSVDVDEKSAADLAYVLTATISNDKGDSVTVSFNRKVPAYKVNTWAEYAAAEKDTPLVVTGYVTGIISKSNDSTNNCLYIQDEVGGYYVYGMTNDPIADLKIEIGMKVEAKGVMDIYNGTLELKDATVTVLDVPAITPEAVDYTELYKNAETLKDTALVEKQGLLVTIKGVELQAQSADDVSGNYYRFKMGELSSYVRLSGSTCPINNAEKETFKKAFTDHVGYTADVTGVICIYDGAFYLTPVSADAYTNFKEIERSDDEKVAFEIENLTVAGKLTSDGEIELAGTGTTYAEVTFTWSSNSEAAVAEGNKITVTIPDEETEIVLTVTATCGTATATREFKVILSKTVTPLADAVALGGSKEHNQYTDDKYLIAGVITEVQNDKYGNMVIKDETGASILIYGTYSADGADRYDALETKPVAGDYIVVLGILGQYNGTAQMKNGWIVTHIVPTTVTGAIELGNTFEKNNYTEDKHVVTGKITEVQNEKYGNVLIADEEGNAILVYGLYSSNGETRYDAMSVKPVVGDTVTVLGVIGKYNDPQLKNAWLIGHTAAEGGESNEGGEASTADATLSFADKANRTEFSASAQKWVANGITFINEKSASTNDVADYSPIRCYKGSSIKVEFAGMKTVVLHCVDKGTAGMEGITIEGATITMEGNVITIAFANAVDSFSVEDLKAQIRFSSIEISK